jgi:hypothetical protein
MDNEPDRERAEFVIQHSRKAYGIPRIKITDTAIEKPETKGDDPLSDLDPDEVF